MVHNLRILDWQKPNEGFDWAQEANNTFKKLISENDHNGLVNYSQLGKSVALSIPTPEHYLPLLYALALQQKDEPLSFFNDKLLMGSISMASLKIG